MDVLPPRWLDVQDEVTETLANVRLSMKTLETLHQKHVLPGFDDDTVKQKEEREIETMTRAITRDFTICQARIRRIEVMVAEAKSQGALKNGEETMAKNLRISLATQVADVSGLFRKRQSAYLKSKLHSYLAECSFADSKTEMRALGGLSDNPGPSQPAQNPYTDPSLMDTENDRASAQSTLLQTKQKKKGALDAVISQREREIEQIAQGVIDLANIFQEMNTMVIDQGTMLDRVDYNVERTNENLKKADKELKTAGGYQKKATKRKIILLLILIVIGMVILVAIKPRRHGEAPVQQQADDDTNEAAATTRQGLRFGAIDVNGAPWARSNQRRRWPQPIISPAYQLEI